MVYTICDKCGFANDDNLKYCGTCGNKLAIPETTTAYSKNYKKIFNIWFWIFTGCFLFILFYFSLIYLMFGSPADLIGFIIETALNIWFWIFIFFIFRFKKNHTSMTLAMSIVFGIIAILAELSPFILRLLNNS